MEKAKEEITNGIDVNIEGSQNFSALHIVAEYGELKRFYCDFDMTIIHIGQSTDIDPRIFGVGVDENGGIKTHSFGVIFMNIYL